MYTFSIHLTRNNYPIRWLGTCILLSLVFLSQGCFLDYFSDLDLGHVDAGDAGDGEDSGVNIEAGPDADAYDDVDWITDIDGGGGNADAGEDAALYADVEVSVHANR